MMIKSKNITTTCPICGEFIQWKNGSTNDGVEYVKTKRRNVLLLHTKCIDKERRIAK